MESNNRLLPDAVPDVSTGKNLPVCEQVRKWIIKLETTREVLGSTHVTCVENMNKIMK